MKYHLTHGNSPHHLDPNNNKSLILKSTQYQLIQGALCKKNYDGAYLIFFEREDINKVLSELHDDLNGGNFEGDTITHKILKASYYLPTLFKDSHAYSWKCQECQKIAGREQ